MPTHRDDLQAIAAGNNNVIGLIPLHQANPPYFQNYIDYINQEWLAQEGLTRSAARRTIKIGLPSVTWLFPSWTQKEYQYFRDTWVNSTDALVTIRTYDDEADEWKNFNGIMLKPQGTFDGIYWNDVRVDITDLREII